MCDAYNTMNANCLDSSLSAKPISTGAKSFLNLLRCYGMLCIAHYAPQLSTTRKFAMHLSLRFRTLPSFIYFALTLLLLSGCGSSAAPAPEATIATGALPNDWQQIDLPPVSLALPAEWAITDASMIDPTSAVTEMASQNPQLQTVLEQGHAALVSGQIQMIAYDLEPERLSETGFPTNVRLGRQTFPEAPALDKVSDVNEQDLRNTTGFSEVQRTPVAIGNLDATRLTSKLELKDAIGNPLALAFEQYLLVKGNEVFVLTFTAPAEVQPNYRTVFDQILGTLRID